MKFKNGDEASFFKILLSDSVDYLELPPAFAKKYLEKGNSKKQTIILKTESTRKWSVTYSKILDRYYFIDGWLCFVQDNHLKKYDFLVFWLLCSSPNSVFQASSYAPTGCLKHPITSSGDGNQLAVKEITGDDDDDDDDDSSLVKVCKPLKIVLKKSYNYQLPLATAFCNTTGITGYDNVQLKNDKGKMWTVELSKYTSKRTICKRIFLKLTRGWATFRKANKMKIKDTFEISHVKRNLLRVRVIKKQKVKLKSR